MRFDITVKYCKHDVLSTGCDSSKIRNNMATPFFIRTNNIRTYGFRGSKFKNIAKKITRLCGA